MKKLFTLMVVVVAIATACQKDVTMNNISNDKESVELSATRSYDEALKIAENALTRFEGEETRSTKRRVIKRTEGQTIMRPVTRGSEAAEEPIMYIFNNENDEGFTVIAANRSVSPIIASTEVGSYTYGESTGVEPFDLLMEDVATSLAFIPDEPMAIMEVIENEEEIITDYVNTQWGTGLVYGAMYPDSIAYSEAPAIAQAILNVTSNNTFNITDPSNMFYGIEIALNKDNMAKHYRYDHPLTLVAVDTTSVHNQIAMFYREIGQRLMSGTSATITNKTYVFTLNKVKSVLESFGCTTNTILSYETSPISPRFNESTDKYFNDAYIFQGTLSNALVMHNGKGSHTWVAPASKIISYENVVYGLNKFYNPSHPNPNDYTEIERTSHEETMLYMNWGFDGKCNGWFNLGCFDISMRVGDYSSIYDVSASYNYNFDQINYFVVQE